MYESNKEKTEELDEKYGFVFEEFKHENKWQAGYFGLIGFKKIIFAFNLVCLNNFPLLNLIIFTIIKLGLLIFTIIIKPHHFVVHSVRDIGTELCFAIIFIASFPLLYEPSDETRKNVAVTIIMATIVILFLELSSILVDYFVMINGFIKTCLKKKKMERNKKS